MKEILESGITKVLMADSFQELSWQIGNYGKDVVWVFDSNTALMVRPLPEPNVILEPGENSKKLTSVQRILETANDSKMTGACTFLGIGGGVVSDVTGFAAAMWNYGSRLVLVPTTLIAMADACVGGRTGIDFRNSKNRVGIYHPAEAVIICTDTLKSLSKTDYANGLAVMVKHAFLSDNDELGKVLILEKQKVLGQDIPTVRKLIQHSLEVKKTYSEPHRRKYLEMGENLAFALTQLYPNRFSYGKALAWGLARCADIAKDLKVADEHYSFSITRMLQSLGFDTDFLIPRTQWQEIKNIINRDRTIAERNVKLVLPVTQGKAEIVEVNEETIKKNIIENALF